MKKVKKTLFWWWNISIFLSFKAYNMILHNMKLHFCHYFRQYLSDQNKIWQKYSLYLGAEMVWKLSKYLNIENVFFDEIFRKYFFFESFKTSNLRSLGENRTFLRWIFLGILIILDMGILRCFSALEFLFIVRLIWKYT